MEEVRSHYCLAGESHSDGCDCQCIPCTTRQKALAQDAFNKCLSQRFKEVFDNSEFRKILAQEILKKK
jgi:hypothetical protein